VLDGRFVAIANMGLKSAAKSWDKPTGDGEAVFFSYEGEYYMIATSKISKRTIRLENSDMFTILFRFPGVILYDIPGFVWSVIIFIFRKSTRNGQSRVNIVYFLGTPLANPRYVYYRAC
jgi:hypothetical protein